MQLFHGNNVVVKNPKILTNGNYKDFGYGFYCTNIENQAKRWAYTKSKKHIINIYDYVENNSLNILKFNEINDSWLDFIADCRRGKPHDYDIVEGPMADDTIWNYVEDYARGLISRAAFYELAKFKYPTHQILFCSEAALEQLSYIRSVRL